jgi:F-type H+-transporting ATPase subunit delta
MKITPNQYAKTLYELTEEKSHNEINDVISEFAKLLAKKNQTRLLPKIIEKLNSIWNKNNGIVEAEVASARKLESHQVHKVESYLKEKYKAKEVVLNNIVNGSIKGGIIIRVGNEVMDASVERHLKDLRIQLER